MFSDEASGHPDPEASFFIASDCVPSVVKRAGSCWRPGVGISYFPPVFFLDDEPEIPPGESVQHNVKYRGNRPFLGPFSISLF
jgi:hypothetical protein